MTVGASVFVKKIVAALGSGFTVRHLHIASVLFPLKIIGRRHHIDKPTHLRVVRATIFRAVEWILPYFCRNEPHGIVVPRQAVTLYTKSGHIEAVDDILRDHGKLNSLTHRYMKLVVFTDAAIGVLQMPHPSFTDDQNLLCIRRWVVGLRIRPCRPCEYHQPDNTGDD